MRMISSDRSPYDKKCIIAEAASSSWIGFPACISSNTLYRKSFLYVPEYRYGIRIVLIFKEKFTRRHAFVLAFAFSGMILVNLPV